MPKRRYRVVYKDRNAKRHTIIVQADSEADAILVAKQTIRRDKLADMGGSAMAVPTED